MVGQGRAGQGRVGQGRAGQGRTGQGRTGFLYEHTTSATVDPVNYALTLAAASSSLILFNFSLFASIILKALASSPSASLNL